MNPKTILEFVELQKTGEKFVTDKHLLTLPKNEAAGIMDIQVEQGWRTNNIQLLTYRNYLSESIASIQVNAGWITNDIQILKITNYVGITIAHEQAERGWTTNNVEILKWSDELNGSVASIQIRKGWTTNNHDILSTIISVGKHYNTIAHMLSYHGWTTKEKSILDLKNSYGTKVSALITRYNIENKPHLLTIQDIKNHKPYICRKYSIPNEYTETKIKKTLLKVSI